MDWGAYNILWEAFICIFTSRFQQKHAVLVTRNQTFISIVTLYRTHIFTPTKGSRLRQPQN